MNIFNPKQTSDTVYEFGSSALSHIIIQIFMLPKGEAYRCLFGFGFYIPVNSYGHVETVSSPNYTFSWASLTKPITSIFTDTFACNRQQPFLNWGKDVNDHRKNF